VRTLATRARPLYAPQSAGCEEEEEEGGWALRDRGIIVRAQLTGRHEKPPGSVMAPLIPGTDTRSAPGGGGGTEGEGRACGSYRRVNRISARITGRIGENAIDSSNRVSVSDILR